jgi:diguanylate cyclase (GGDEF)-like protein
MQRLSTTDPLTGLFNRGNMFAHGKRELSRAIRYGNSLSLVLLDIDQLKEINEVSGHFAGDKVIKALANFLQETCRRSDVVGRLSGKELLLLLPETELKMAMAVAEKWRDAISELKVNLDRDNSIAFNCSIGVTSASKEEQFEVLLKNVESNLQAAKAAGGNQVACEEQE